MRITEFPVKDRWGLRWGLWWGLRWGLGGDWVGTVWAQKLDHSAKVRVDIGDSGRARQRMPGAWDAGV